jgi:hypothetical protein
LLAGALIAVLAALRVLRAVRPRIATAQCN